MITILAGRETVLISLFSIVPPVTVLWSADARRIRGSDARVASRTRGNLHILFLFGNAVLRFQDNPRRAPVSMSLRIRAEYRRRNMVGHRASGHDDARKWDLAFWQSCTPQQRLSALVDIHRDIRRINRKDKKR